MRAMVYRGPYKIRVEEKDRPAIDHPTDAIVRVTRAAIGGSDLHLYHGRAAVDPGRPRGRVGEPPEVLRHASPRRPDHPGGRAERVHLHGLSSRIGTKRADLGHRPLDPVVVAGPWVAAAGAAYLGARTLLRAVRR